MKLLSICVPTYNRNKELSELVQHFLLPALDAYPDVIEVIVCDNSDSDVALANQAVLDNGIQYRKNEMNMGFAGNLLRCVSEANATYIWIISDDDPVLWPGFEELMGALPQADADGVGCVMLPYQTANNFGDKVPTNRHNDWKVERETNIVELLRTGKIPFILFSSAVVRLDKKMLPELKAKFFNNDYLQVILILEMLNTENRVRFMTKCVIDYQTEYEGRCSVSSMAGSMTVLSEYLYHKFGVPKDEKSQYSGWLRVLMHHRGGLYKIKDADQDRWKFLGKLPQYMGLKNLVLAVALILPSRLFRPAYIWYRSYKDVQKQGKFSFAELRQRMAANRKFINSLKCRV